jgi:hypothetical protein
MSKQRYKIVPGAGDPCPRCKQATQIREHITVGPKQRFQPFYYSRWFNCTNANCQTTLIMPERFKVFPEEAAE